MEITNKRELQQVVINHSSDTDFKDFIKIYKKCTTEKYRYLVTDMTLTSDNPLRLKKIFQIKYIRKSLQLMMRLKMRDFNTIFI